MRSVDKAYEIVVYALFNALVKHLRIKVSLSVDVSQSEILLSFKDFTKAVLGVDDKNPTIILDAKLYRAGTTNAADRGIDMWSNFGPIIQVKHLTLTEDLADDITESVAADRIIIVCKDGEKETVERVLKQLGQQIQSIIVQSQLIEWYEKSFSKKYIDTIGADIIGNLRLEFKNEFPYSKTLEPFFSERGYDKIKQNTSLFWESST